MIRFDYIVIGVGSMGSATCYHLAKRGKAVLGIEQFTIPHELGSHAGESRIIRKAYFEHPDYIPLLIRAYDNWYEIMERSGRKLYHQTGLLYAAPRGHQLLENIKHSASLYKIPLSAKTHELIQTPSDFETIFEPEAGFVEPENTIRSFVAAAIDLGAEIHERETLQRFEGTPKEVIVETDRNTYSCRKLVFTAGAWSAKLIPGISDHLRITRQVLAWLKPSRPEIFTEDKFPCWLIATEKSAGVFYGFPVLPSHPHGLKLAYHYPDQETDPNLVKRSVEPEETKNLVEFAERFLPSGVGEIESTKTCLYSNTPDEHFVIDNLPGMEEQVCMAWGFSGHGFKFVPAVGEILADLAMYHKTELPIGFLRLKRLKDGIH